MLEEEGVLREINHFSTYFQARNVVETATSFLFLDEWWQKGRLEWRKSKEPLARIHYQTFWLAEQQSTKEGTQKEQK